MAVVKIHGIAAGGEGVGRLPDGCTVFVHRTAPGDVVEVEVTQRRRRWARARLVRLLQGGSDRCTPPCPFYRDCGGCTLQHLTLQAQHRAKEAIVAETLSRLGGIFLTSSPPVIPSPAPWRYRNRMTFLLRREGSTVRAGLHALGEPARLVEVDERCLLGEEAVAVAWGRLRQACRQYPVLLPPGVNTRATLRATTTGDVALQLESEADEWNPRPLAAASGPWVAVWQRRGGEPPFLLAGGEAWDQWAGERVLLGAGSFLQVNRAGAVLLYEEVERQLGEVRGLRVVEAYAGVGLVARRLARAGARVTALEGHPLAAAEARRAGEFEVIAGPVERHLVATLPADVVVLNPPRAGLSTQVTGVLCQTPPRRLIYVSCDPATLARDLGRMAEVFTVVSVGCVDLFPQTTHVETVATLAAR